MPRRVTKPEEYRELRRALKLDPDITPRLSQRLRELRTEHGLSLADVAQICGLSGRGALGQWETLGVSPDVPMLLMLADLYGVSLDYLIGRPKAVRDSETLRLAKLQLNARLMSLDLTSASVRERVAQTWRLAQEVDATAFPPRRIGGLVGGLEPEVFDSLVSGGFEPSGVILDRYAWALGIPEQFLLIGRYP